MRSPLSSGPLGDAAIHRPSGDHAGSSKRAGLSRSSWFRICLDSVLRAAACWDDQKLTALISQPTYESKGAPIRSPRRAHVVGRIGCQSDWLDGTDPDHVNIKIILLLA